MPDTISQLLTNVTMWTGASVGLLKVGDWLLTDGQKRRVKDFAETAWFWLSDQRAGRFTGLLRSYRAQRIFSLATHGMLVGLTLAFLVQTYFGIDLHTSMNIGFPRLYRFQVWVDVVALFFSAVLISRKWHPRIASWIAQPESLPSYFGRTLLAMVVGFGAMFVILIPKLLISSFALDAFDAPAKDVGSLVETRLGGHGGVVAIHALTAFITAPLLAEMLMLNTILFLSFYWLVLVWFGMLVLRVSQFFCFRIAESTDGPVLAISGLLVAIGAVAKAFLG